MLTTIPEYKSKFSGYRINFSNLRFKSSKEEESKKLLKSMAHLKFKIFWVLYNLAIMYLIGKSGKSQQYQ